MTTHISEERLNDYVDGVLAAEHRGEVERHAADCPSCRQDIEALRSLLKQASELPEIQPRRDLLPGIRAAIAPRRSVWPGFMAFAASFLIVAVAAGVLLRDRPESAPALDELQNAERQYLDATRRLLAVLEQRREEIRPETLATLEDNMRIIDRAILEASVAIERDAADSRDAHLLTALYRKKLELLWKASRLAS